MALTEQDIFPLSTTQGAWNTATILEPYTCTRELHFPTARTVAEVRLVYTKRISHPFYRFQFDYKNIMSWEYYLIEEFYYRMKGMYESFYLVDWSAPYTLSAYGGTSVTVDRVQGLQEDTGYGGNTLLMYNGAYLGVNKQKLTISSIAGSVVSVNEGVNGTLASLSGTKVYVLYACAFDGENIKATVVDNCTVRQEVNYPGIGTKNMFGPIMELSIPFIQVGVMK